MTDWKLPWQGGCRCGQVRFVIEAPPLLTMACHCTGCQRMSASAYSLSVAIPTPGFHVASGEPIIGGLHGPTRHYFCPHCMSWMFTRPEGMDDFVNVRATMLDHAGWYAPFIETFTSEALPWAKTPAPHKYDRFPPMDAFPKLLLDYAVWAKGPS